MSKQNSRSSEIAAEDPISQEQINRRWKIRRRIAVIAFVEVLIGPAWAIPLFKLTSESFAESVVGSVLFSLMAIVLAYIGGALIDDNLHKWKGK